MICRIFNVVVLGGRGLAWEGVATGIKLSGLFNHRFQCLNSEDSDDGDSPRSTNPSSTPSPNQTLSNHIHFTKQLT